MKKLKMGILGVEHCHMPGYAQGIKHGAGDLFQVTCVADSNVDKGERIAGYFGAKYYRDYEDLLQKEQIDCVFLLRVGPWLRATLELGTTSWRVPIVAT